LTAKDEWGAIAEDQVEILVIDPSLEGDQVMAFISSPEENEMVVDAGNIVTISAEGSYVIEIAGGAVTCLYGSCPAQTSTVPQTPISGTGAALTTYNLLFKWRTIFNNDYEMSSQARGNESNSVDLFRWYPNGIGQKLLLDVGYYDDNDILQDNSIALRTFGMTGEPNGISCDKENELWLYANGSDPRESSDNCLIQDYWEPCCQDGFECVEEGGMHTCQPGIEPPEDPLGCGKYLTPEECGNDTDDEWETIVPDAPLPNCKIGTNIAYDDDGYSYHLDCECFWNASLETECVGTSELICDDCDFNRRHEGTSKPKLGKCVVIKAGDDDCEDGFLEYSWGANYTWDSDNEYDTQQDCKDETGTEDLKDCLLHSGKYRYDPINISGQCNPGSNIIICPAQIQLPFFGFMNVLVVIAILIFIYSYLIIRKK
jgi:hypothetical protein